MEAPAHMRYVWRANLQFRTLRYALTRRPNLSDPSIAPGRKTKGPIQRYLPMCVWWVGGQETPRRKQAYEPPTPFDVVMDEFDKEMVDIIESQRREEQEVESRRRGTKKGETYQSKEGRKCHKEGG